jgi:endonuclease/exonuclease/phosphatase family metal-dependent hydrolase
MRCRCILREGVCLVAGSLFFCGFVPAADEPPPVTFVAWNLQNYLCTSGPQPSVRQRGGNKPKPEPEIAAVTAILAALKPDILGVCEMGSPDDLAALQERLRGAGLDLPHSEHVQAADDTRHLALLSRYPIAGREPQTRLTYLLDNTRLPVQRGFLDVTIQITPDYRLRCVGAHLKSRRDVPEANESLMRRNEAHLLRQHADAILTKDPDTNLLVYGDFNDTRDEPAIRAIAGTRGADTALTPVLLADDEGERWTYYFAQSDTYSRFDYLYASRGLNPELEDKACRIYSGADWSRASDHRPLGAVILPVDQKLRGRKPPAAED